FAGTSELNSRTKSNRPHSFELPVHTNQSPVFYCLSDLHKRPAAYSSKHWWNRPDKFPQKHDRLSGSYPAECNFFPISLLTRGFEAAYVLLFRKTVWHRDNFRALQVHLPVQSKYPCFLAQIPVLLKMLPPPPEIFAWNS